MKIKAKIASYFVFNLNGLFIIEFEGSCKLSEFSRRKSKMKGHWEMFPKHGRNQRRRVSVNRSECSLKVLAKSGKQPSFYTSPDF